MLSFKPSKINVLFCLYSQAEASDLSEIYTKINDRKAVIRVLAFGAARDFLLKKNPGLLIPIDGLEEIGEKGCYREKKIKKETFQKIVESIEQSNIFITGFGSNFQLDILKRISPESKIFSIGYYDPFQSFQDHAFAKRLFQREEPISLDALLVPCLGLKEECASQFPKMDIQVVGKRDLDHFESSPKEKNWDILKRASLNWNPENLTFLYGGCYGPGYKDDFRLFLKSIKDCRKLVSKTIDVWVSLHPAKECTGEFEREEIKKFELDGVIVCQKNIPTVSLLPFADLYLSSTSGTVLSANAFGVPSFYISKNYSNYLIAKQIVQKAVKKKEVVKLFKNAKPLETSLLRNEIPKNATENIANYLNKVINSLER